MNYIFPIPAWLRGELLEHKRLYSFPSIPEGNPFILDSGAFGLSKSGRRMDDEYQEKLYLHYKKYTGWKVAPDEYFNPKKTMKNFKTWMMKYPDCKVCPVIQWLSKNFEWPIIAYQLDFYSEILNAIKFLFFATPKSFKAFQLPKDICKKIKDNYSVDWIHIFGAGFYPQDIQSYVNMTDLDSIDSTAYYNAVNTVSGNWTKNNGTRKQKAIANANYVRKFFP